MGERHKLPIQPPPYHPGPLPPTGGTHGVGAPFSVNSVQAKPVQRGVPSPAGTVIQPIVPTGSAKYTENRSYFVLPGQQRTLYSSPLAKGPRPVELYTKEFDFTDRGKPVYLWTPNVLFLSKQDREENDDLTVEQMTTEFQRQTGRPIPPILLLGKNDCANFATVLSCLINTTPSRREAETREEVQKLTADVGEMMKHTFGFTQECNYHAATVVAKDGRDLVTLEADVSQSLLRPEFHIRRGVIEFVDYNSQDKEQGYRVVVSAAGKESKEKFAKLLKNVASGEYDSSDIGMLLKQSLLLIKTPAKPRRRSGIPIFMVLLLLFAFYLYLTGRLSRSLH